MNTHILIVEDHPFQRNVLLKLVGKYGVKADVVRTSKDAIAALKGSEVYQLVIMDWQLADPDEDGLDCIRQIRALDEKSGNHTVIIGLTGNSSPEDRDACLSAGMDDYFTKPLTIEKFETVLEKWLNIPVAKPE